MQQTVYVDVLLAVNLFVNYFLLLTVRGFLHIPCRRSRLLLGAAVGALGSLLILVPALPAALSVLAKLAVSTAVVFAAFFKMRPVQMLRAFVCFYLVSFAYAGFMLAVWYFISPERIVIKNSMVYFDISPLLLALLTVAAYGAVSLLNRLAGQREASGGFCTVIVEIAGACARCTGKIDTGSTLVEPFSRDPVVVVGAPALDGVLPEGIKAALRCGAIPRPDEEEGAAEDGAGNKRPMQLRLVPFSDLSGGGVLPAFRPDRLWIRRGKEKIEICDCYVAVREAAFSGRNFDALLNPALLARGKHCSGKEEEE